jgi:hypothetical protein
MPGELTAWRPSYSHARGYVTAFQIETAQNPSVCSALKPHAAIKFLTR